MSELQAKIRSKLDLKAKQNEIRQSEKDIFNDLVTLQKRLDDESDKKGRTMLNMNTLMTELVRM